METDKKISDLLESLKNESNAAFWTDSSNSQKIQNFIGPILIGC